MKRAALCLATLTILALVPVSADATALSGDQIRETLAGKRIYLKVPLHGEFPLYYRNDGRVSGDGTALGLGRVLAPRETGRWWIRGDQMCQQWPTWYRGRAFCFELTQLDADKLRWQRDDGRSGIARIAH